MKLYFIIAGKMNSLTFKFDQQDTFFVTPWFGGTNERKRNDKKAFKHLY